MDTTKEIMNKKYRNNLLRFLLFGSTERNLFISNPYFPPYLPSLEFCRPERLHPPSKATQLCDTNGRIGSFCGKLLTIYCWRCDLFCHLQYFSRVRRM